MVDVVSDLRIEIAERIVGQPGQMHHRVEAEQIAASSTSRISLRSVGTS